MELARIVNAQVSTLVDDPTKVVLALTCSDGTAKAIVLSGADVGKLVTVLLRQTYQAGKELQMPPMTDGLTVVQNPIPIRTFAPATQGQPGQPRFLSIDIGLTQLVFQLPE